MDLEIVGRHTLLFDDDATAELVNSGSSLVPWAVAPDLLLDRHDVRHLLDRVPPRPRRPYSASADGAVSAAELDSERFLDLPSDAGAEEGLGAASPSDEGKRKSSEAGQSVYNAVPFSYGSTGVSIDPETHDSFYRPSFPVPENLLNNLPPSEKAHQIIARTAVFVSEHGGQSEIILRVKQGNNPTFGFLMPDHRLHGYFRYLVDHPQLLKAGTLSTETNKSCKSGNSENLQAASSGGALSLLGSIYGSGEDDEGMLPVGSESMDPGSQNITHEKSGQEQEGSAATPHEDKEIKKDLTAAITDKEKPIFTKTNQIFSGDTIVAGSREKLKDAMAALQTTAARLQKTQPSVSERKELILEPPSFLKRTMEKIIEFVLRNGKEFEEKLIEQDKAIGRFPFLLSSNQYHPYYLKVLQDAHESKLRGRSSSERKDGSYGNQASKSKARATTSRDSSASDRSSVEPLEKRLSDQKGMGKFKMVIGGPKKEAYQQSAPRRVTADEAAAIVMAATRGVSPANPAPNGSTEQLGLRPVCGNAGRTSSFGSFSSLQGPDVLSKPVSNSEAGTSCAAGRQLNKEGAGIIDDEWIAKTIAKTAALAASREADSSEASLTREQKLKAERLRRAKMFAAIIKSGGNQTTDLATTANPSNEHTEASPADLNCSVADPDPLAKEREGSSVPFENERSNLTKREKDDDDDEHNRVRKYRKKRHSVSDEEKEDSEESYKHSRERHRSGHSRGHSEDGGHKHGRRHSSRDGSSRHHHRHHRSSSDDEHGHRSSRSQRRHRDHDHDSGDEELGRSHKHRRHRRDHDSSRKVEGEDERGQSESTLHRSEPSQVALDHQHESEKPPADTAQSSDATTEVPDDLRAKIRAMLRETL